MVQNKERFICSSNGTERDVIAHSIITYYISQKMSCELKNL